MNQVTFMGRLTKEPELRYTTSQVAVANFSLAVPRRKQKDKEQETDFFSVIAWRQKAEFAHKHLRKGQRVVVTGEIQNRSYTDRDGNKRTATEVIASDIHFADSKTDGQGGGYANDDYYDDDDLPKY